MLLQGLAMWQLGDYYGTPSSSFALQYQYSSSFIVSVSPCTCAYVCAFVCTHESAFVCTYESALVCA